MSSQPDDVARRRAADYGRRRYQQRLAGTWNPFTGTAPVREHLAALNDAGLDMQHIADTAGVSLSTLTRLGKTSATQMSTAAAQAILAVPAPDPRQAAAQLQALVGDGWGVAQLAEHSGLSSRTVGRILMEETRPTWRVTITVADLYERLRHEDPGDGPAATRSRRRAERASWTPATPPPPPENDIDEVAVQRAVDGETITLRPAERDLALRQLAGHQPDHELARRLGVSTRTTLRHRSQHDLPAYSPLQGPNVGPNR